jgi:hypothetical protein
VEKLATLRRSVLILTLLASGCAGVLRNEPFVDSRTNTDGVVILLDTPRMWEYWRKDVDRAISAELSGKAPGGGIETWTEQWTRVIHANRNRENSQRYIQYIFSARRQAGLPELPVGE